MIFGEMIFGEMIFGEMIFGETIFRVDAHAVPSKKGSHAKREPWR